MRFYLRKIMASGEKILLLVVEDNPVAQIAVQHNLTSLGYSSEVASSGEEATRKSSEKHYDIIFMDIGLEEGTDGFLVIEQIKQHCALNKTTPIVILTTHSEEIYRLKAKEMGIVHFIVKPLNAEEAKKVVTDLCISKSNNKNRVNQIHFEERR